MTKGAAKAGRKATPVPPKDSDSCGSAAKPVTILDLLDYPGMEDIDFDPPRLSIIVKPIDLT